MWHWNYHLLTKNCCTASSFLETFAPPAPKEKNILFMKPNEKHLFTYCNMLLTYRIVGMFFLHRVVLFSFAFFCRKFCFLLNDDDDAGWPQTCLVDAVPKLLHSGWAPEGQMQHLHQNSYFCWFTWLVLPWGLDAGRDWGVKFCLFHIFYRWTNCNPMECAEWRMVLVIYFQTAIANKWVIVWKHAPRKVINCDVLFVWTARLMHATFNTH